MATPKFAAGEQAVVLDPRGHTYVHVLTATRRRVVVRYYSSTLVFRRRDPSGPWVGEGQRLLVTVAVFRELFVEREAKLRAAEAEETATQARERLARFERAHPEEMPGWEALVPEGRP